MSLSLQEQYNKIYKYCYFKVNDSYLAEDLTQETLLRFFEQNSYINRGKPLAYLYTIAGNLCIDSFRKRKEQPLTDDEAVTDAAIETLESTMMVKGAIATLPNDFQEILLLRYSSELSMKEICWITGLSRFAVRRKINGALERVKIFLREEDSV